MIIRKLVQSMAIAVLMLNLVACRSSNNIETTDYITPSSQPITTIAPTESLDPVSNAKYQDVSIQRIQDTINNYYINLLRRFNSQRIVEDQLFEGQDVQYNVYDAGNNYALVKIESEFAKDTDKEFFQKNVFVMDGDEFYLSGTRYFGQDANQIFEQQHELKQISTDELPLICSGSFHVDSNHYDDFAGKREIIKFLTEKIRYRYFNHSQEKDYNYEPVFHETTSAVKVDLLDFDEKSDRYDMLVYTKDGYVYSNMWIEYNEPLGGRYYQSTPYYNPDGSFEIIEFHALNITVFKLTDIENIDAYKESIRDDDIALRNLTNFMIYYNYAQNHIIKEISE